MDQSERQSLDQYKAAIRSYDRMIERGDGEVDLLRRKRSESQKAYDDLRERIAERTGVPLDSIE